MKWMKWKRPESHVIPEQDKESKAFAPFVNWPFVKGIPIDLRQRMRVDTW